MAVPFAAGPMVRNPVPSSGESRANLTSACCLSNFSTHRRTPNNHDMLTGSQADGRTFPPNEDKTCHNWTSSTKGTAIVGHIDRKGLRDDAESNSWNSSHPSRGPDGGCSQNDLRSTGGNSLFYCFASN
jgi:hypothetical protein